MFDSNCGSLDRDVNLWIAEKEIEATAFAVAISHLDIAD